MKNLLENLPATKSEIFPVPSDGASNNSFPPEAQKALDNLYAQYGNHQTTLQKIAIMKLLLGTCNVSLPPGETHDNAKLAVMEYDWLDRKRLITLQYV